MEISWQGSLEAEYDVTAEVLPSIEEKTADFTANNDACATDSRLETEGRSSSLVRERYREKAANLARFIFHRREVEWQPGMALRGTYIVRGTEVPKSDMAKIVGGLDADILIVLSGSHLLRERTDITHSITSID